jgi:hypothetical protein
MAIPASMAGTATTKPAIGPATPTSKRIGLVRMAPRMRMKAPSVPVKLLGKGRKNGSDASTR